MSFVKLLLLCTSAAVLLSACGSNETAEPTPDETNTVESPAISVKLAEVEIQDLQSWVFGEGTSRAVQREFLSFESAGRIAYVDPDLKEGDSVTKGQLIAYQQQDRPNADLAGARASVSDAKTQVTLAEATQMESAASLELAQKTFDRFEVLLEQRSASQQEYDEAFAQLKQARAAKLKADRQAEASFAQVSAAEAQLSSANVTAEESRLISPINGVIARLNIEQGYYFSPQQVQSTSEQGALDTVPVVIIDPSIYEISVNIPSYESNQIEPNARVLIEMGKSTQNIEARSIDANGGPSRASDDYRVRGEVYAVSPSLDPATRTFQVKLRTTEGAEFLRDGEYVTVWIAGQKAENALTIPSGSARYANSEAFVFVYNAADKTVSRKPIVMGLQGNGTNQVISGLSAGDKIVREGRSKLSDGDTVRVLTEQN